MNGAEELPFREKLQQPLFHGADEQGFGVKGYIPFVRDSRLNQLGHYTPFVADPETVSARRSSLMVA